MPEIGKAEWESIRKDVHEFRSTIAAVNVTVTSLDEFRKQAEPNMWFVHYLKSILTATFGAFGLFALTSASGVIWYTASQFSTINEVAKHQRENIETLSKELKDLRKEHDKLFVAHESIRRHVTVLYDRQSKGPVNLPEALVINGTVARITETELTVLPQDMGEPAIRFRVPDSHQVIYNGKPAKISDLRIDTKITVVLAGGRIIRIIASDKE